jgi:hypothetical protein
VKVDNVISGDSLASLSPAKAAPLFPYIYIIVLVEEGRRRHIKNSSDFSRRASAQENPYLS